MQKVNIKNFNAFKTEAPVTANRENFNKLDDEPDLD
jgi:hypothetical protein